MEAALLGWYAKNGRELPWRRTRDPYAILISEVMLQQTQVERVIPRWLAWLERWPDPTSLAAASPGDVIRGADHRSNTELQQGLSRALGFDPPEYVHHGLLLGPDGKKLSKRAGAPTLASYRDAGVPAEAMRAYLEELGEPAHDVHLDEPRLRRLAIDAIESLSDEELAARAGAPPQLARALRGARDLVEARAMAAAILEPQPVSLPEEARPTLERFAALRASGLDGKDIVRELKAVGGDLKALRLALTGVERGPELWTVIAALPQDEALRRVDAAL